MSLSTASGTGKEDGRIFTGRKKLGGGDVKPQKKSRIRKGRGKVNPPNLFLGGRSDLGFREDGGGGAQRNGG